MLQDAPPPQVLEIWQELATHGPLETHGWAILPVTVLCSLFTFVAVAIRLYMRAFVQRKVDVEDWLILIVALPAIAYYIFVCVSTKFMGCDHHTYNLTITELVRAGKISFACDAAYLFLTTMVKMAILLFYLRLADRSSNKAFIYATHACIGFSAAWCITFTGTLLFTCAPVIAFWEQADSVWTSTHDFRCANQAPMVMTAAISVVLINFVIAVLPIKLFWNLQMPRKQRYGLIFVFAVGFCASGGAIARAYNIYISFYETYDHLWPYYWVEFWTAVEVAISVVCSCAPAIRAFYVHTNNSGGLVACLKGRSPSSTTPLQPLMSNSKPGFTLSQSPPMSPLSPFSTMTTSRSRGGGDGRHYFTDAWVSSEIGDGITTSKASWGEKEDDEEAWRCSGLDARQKELAVVVKSVVMVDLEEMQEPSTSMDSLKRLNHAPGWTG